MGRGRGAQDPRPVKTVSDGERQAFAKAASAAQVATVTYSYSLSPDFTQIRVIADVALWKPVGKQGGLTPLYRQRIAAIAELSKRSYDHAENVALWSAGAGALARASITAAVGRLERLIPFALGLTQADLNALDNPKADRQFAAGFYGPPVKAFAIAPGETLIWSKALISAMPAQE